jgi:hypothetical protein
MRKEREISEGTLGKGARMTSVQHLTLSLEWRVQELMRDFFKKKKV